MCERKLKLRSNIVLIELTDIHPPPPSPLLINPIEVGFPTTTAKGIITHRRLLQKITAIVGWKIKNS